MISPSCVVLVVGYLLASASQGFIWMGIGHRFLPILLTNQTSRSRETSFEAETQETIGDKSYYCKFKRLDFVRRNNTKCCTATNLLLISPSLTLI